MLRSHLLRGHANCMPEPPREDAVSVVDKVMKLWKL